MRYKKLGTINKRKGLQMWEFNFNYSLLPDDNTEVFVVSKPKRPRTTCSINKIGKEVK